MMKVNVYDFDKTLIPYDSTEAFYKHCAGKYPRSFMASLAALPRAALFCAGLCSINGLKDTFYRFLRFVPDVDSEVELFWKEHIKDINPWYLNQSERDDIIISASPDFLVRPAADWLGVRLIASRVCKYTGITAGLNNDGAEKVRRLRAEYPDTEIAKFYSDSKHDLPLAKLADEAWLVKGEILSPWRL